MRSSKSRSRNKSNRQRSLGNIVNRVFDSSGPEGKVRGTPQQIIEKYLTLARDAQLSNDRVAEQSFFQHAEHYTRMLGEAQREMSERQQQNPQHGQSGRQSGQGEDESAPRRDQHGGQNGGYQGGQNGRGQGGRDSDRRQEDLSATAGDAGGVDQSAAQDRDAGQPQPGAAEAGREARRDEPAPQMPEAVGFEPGDGPQAVDTPEERAEPKAARASRAPRAPRTPRSTTGRSRRKPAGEGETVPETADGADSIAGDS